MNSGMRFGVKNAWTVTRMATGHADKPKPPPVRGHPARNMHERMRMKIKMDLTIILLVITITVWFIQTIRMSYERDRLQNEVKCLKKELEMQRHERR